MPLSHDILQEIILEGGFDLLDESKVISSYFGEEVRSMKPEVYHIPLSVYKLVNSSKRLSMTFSPKKNDITEDLCTDERNALEANLREECSEVGNGGEVRDTLKEQKQICEDIYPTVNFILKNFEDR